MSCPTGCGLVVDYLKKKILTVVMLVMLATIVALAVTVVFLNVRIQHQGAQLHSILLEKALRRVFKNVTLKSVLKKHD